METTEMKWVRSKDGLLAGVCQGLGERFGIEIWILRLLWILSFFCFGTGLFIYLLLALCLPREDRLESAFQKKVLGVCVQLSAKYDMEIGLVRFLAVILALSSLGLTVVAYVALYFLLPEDNSRLASRGS